MTGRRRWLVPVAAVVIAITPLVVGTVRTLSRGWMAIGDNGLILLRSHDVATANHPLLGTWTSASLAAGRNINNPGPLWFDLLAPFVRVGGASIGFAVGVLVANIAAIVGAAWAAHRTGGERAVVAVCALSAGLAWSMGSELLFDAWQPHAMILPFWALLVMCWCLAAGDALMAPFVVAIASLLVQTHLSFVYVVAVIGGAALAMVAVGLRWPAILGTSRTRPGRDSLRRIGLWTVVVAALAWIQPLLDQLTGERNLTNLLATSRSDGLKLGARLGTRITASVIALPPWWTRPGFSSIVRPTPRGQTMTTSAIASPGSALLGLLVVLAVLVLVVTVGWRRRSRPVLVLGLLAGAALAAALLSMALMPVGLIGISPHQMRWLWPISAFVLLAALVAVAEWPPVRRAVVPVGLAVTALLSVLNLPTYAAREGPTADRRYTRTTMALMEQLASYRPTGPVLFDGTGLRFAEPYSGALLSELARNGVDVVAAEEGLIRQLGQRRRASGEELLSIRIVEGAEMPPPPGARRLASVQGLDAAETDELERLRGTVIEVAARDGLRLNEAGQEAAREGRLAAAQEVLAPGGDAPELEANGALALLVVSQFLDLDPTVTDTFERYGELFLQRARQTVAVYEVPVGSP